MRPFAQPVAEQESKIVGTALHKPYFLRHPVENNVGKQIYKLIASRALMKPSK